MQEGQLLMTQAERDRLVALKKAKKKLITQKQAAEELGITERHVRRLLRELNRRGDKVVAHGLRGLPSNRKINADPEREAVSILLQPVAFYTDKASSLQTAERTRRDGSRVGKSREELPPAQIGRVLRELGVPWIAAHSPQAKGRVERGFLTAQDRLVKGLCVAGVTTLEQANHYLETEFLPCVSSTLAVAPANPDDAEGHHVYDRSLLPASSAGAN